MTQRSPAGGFGGGRCKPPNGARGGAPEANAFWQQSIENWLKSDLWVADYTPNSDPILIACYMITWFIMRRLRIHRVMGYDII